MPNQNHGRAGKPAKTNPRNFTANLAAVCLCSLLLPPSPALAITEAEFIDKVLAQDKLLEEAQIGLDIKQIEVDASRDNYRKWKAEVSVDLGYRYRDLERGVPPTRDYTSQTRDYPKEVSLDFEKRFLSSPGSLQMGVSRANDKGIEVLTDLPNATESKAGRGILVTPHPVKEYITEHYVQFKYPLLKLDSNALSLKTYHRDIIDLRRQQLSFYETKEDFLDDRLQDYLRWIFYQKRDLLERQFLEKLQWIPLEGEAEVALLRSEIFEIENDNADTRIQLQAIKERLSVLLDDRKILTETPKYDFQKRTPLLSENAQEYLQNTNRDLRRIALSVELNQIEIAYYQNQRRPRLDVTLRAERDLNKGNTRTSSFDDQRTNYSADLAFSYPLGGSISVRTNLQKFLLGVRKLEISYEEKLQDILADIKLLNAKLTLDEKRLLDAIEAARQSASIEYENYRAGRTSFRDLLQAYRDEHDAKLEHIEDVIEYQSDGIEYDNLLDKIIETPCRAEEVGSEDSPECAFE